MTELSATTQIFNASPSLGGPTQLYFESTTALIGGTDTLAIDLSKYGLAANQLKGLLTWLHTTDGSVVVAETDVTTAVSGTTLTLTFGDSTTGRRSGFVWVC